MEQQQAGLDLFTSPVNPQLAVSGTHLSHGNMKVFHILALLWMKRRDVAEEDTHHTSRTVNPRQVDLVHEADNRRVLRVSGTTVYFQTVYSAFINSLKCKQDKRNWHE